MSTDNPPIQPDPNQPSPKRVPDQPQPADTPVESPTPEDDGDVNESTQDEPASV